MLKKFSKEGKELLGKPKRKRGGWGTGLGKPFEKEVAILRSGGRKKRSAGGKKPASTKKKGRKRDRKREEVLTSGKKGSPDGKDAERKKKT